MSSLFWVKTLILDDIRRVSTSTERVWPSTSTCLQDVITEAVCEITHIYQRIIFYCLSFLLRNNSVNWCLSSQKSCLVFEINITFQVDCSFHFWVEAPPKSKHRDKHEFWSDWRRNWGGTEGELQTRNCTKSVACTLSRWKVWRSSWRTPPSTVWSTSLTRDT